MKAYCWADGVIEFGRNVPEGALLMAEGPAKTLRELISATARHAYDGETLLVPGIPEAKDQSEAGDALGAHLEWISKRRIPGITFCRMLPEVRA